MNGYRLDAQGLAPRRHHPREAFLAAGWLPSRESAYLCMKARLSDFTRSDLDRLVFTEGAFAEVGSVRGQAHIVPRELGPAALRCPAPSLLLAGEQVLQRSAVPEAGRPHLKEAVLLALERGPLPLPDLLQRVAAVPGASARFLGMPGVLPSLLTLMRLDGEVVRTRLAPPLDAGPPVFVRTADAFPGLDVAGLDPRDALRILCAFYFRVHGPATKADFGWWSGAGRTEVAEVFAAHRERLSPVRLGELPFTYWLPPSRLEELLATSRPGVEPVVLVPFGDPWLGSHEGQSGRFVRAEDLASAVPGSCLPLVLVGGVAAGRFEYHLESKEIRISWFRGVSEGVRERAERVAEEYAAWIATEMTDLRPLSVPGEGGNVPVYV